jgi:hypothetical protein
MLRMENISTPARCGLSPASGCRVPALDVGPKK